MLTESLQDKSVIEMLPTFCFSLFCFSAFAAERISSDQTHQCRDFLLQGSTVQQTRGRGKTDFYLSSLLLNFLFDFSLLCMLSCFLSLVKLRTRSSLLESLQAELSTRSQCMMGDPSLSALPSSEGARGVSEGSGGFIENFKVNVSPSRSSGFRHSLMIFSLWLFFFWMSVIREPSECGATHLRLLGCPERAVAVHHRNLR